MAVSITAQLNRVTLSYNHISCLTHTHTYIHIYIHTYIHILFIYIFIYFIVYMWTVRKLCWQWHWVMTKMRCWGMLHFLTTQTCWMWILQPGKAGFMNTLLCPSVLLSTLFLCIILWLSLSTHMVVLVRSSAPCSMQYQTSTTASLLYLLESTQVNMMTWYLLLLSYFYLGFFTTTVKV